VILNINPLNAKLNLICHFLALLGAHLVFHVSRIRVNITLNVMVHYGFFGYVVKLQMYIYIPLTQP
jgi:hypothetical protein